MNKNIKIIIFAFLFIFVFVVFALVFDIGRKDDVEPINFEECVLKGYPIQETFPRQCRASEGGLFTENIGDANDKSDKSDLIKVNTPLPNEIVKSPLLISGIARGYWFFEGSFPIKLVDDGNNEIASGIAQAEGEWMTTKFVPFKAEFKFEKPLIKTGKLILKKDNPSDFREYDDEFVIPLAFD